MKIRAPYPDEIGRAKSLLNGHPVPPEAGFLVAVKEQPVERLIATIPWWKCSLPDSEDQVLRYFLNSGTLEIETLKNIQTQLDELAHEHGVHQILTDFALPAEHPLYRQLLEMGYEIARTEHSFAARGDSFKSHTLQNYEAIKSQVPPEWKTTSIRGHDPQKLYALVAAHGLMSPQQFQNYWNTASRERFEEDYSFVLTAKDELLGLILVSQRGKAKLHIHLEIANPKNSQASLILACLRHASCSECADGFPATFTWQTHSEELNQTDDTTPPESAKLSSCHYLERTI